ncbi:hypothetical protein VF14_06390 [Nostoc linckia z18]|uniref:SnoaL-like domain-containing protein n=2 Tax=Nostoc linckia TaxID=92942 RepID=A0A9Q5ZBB0_NOSLI|nr:nuclear transport factor 2 family protein [Nostoc linckia]PHK41670.1 hypothetical protein VF12_05740 [Nostoc linckia z15]PHK47264.1 hypothetical protein VF13_06175 [Nostoc linckia z16]PHJ63080.1 hypothetical protein VF02_15655 [Nostoc linckia z1]PHJ72263.1 hypothetical protein VF05_04845 [Nostoc linckia z3]PHJ75703.1 hypothetical protein VF03_09650 [Nostoc linckia z2]
MEKRRENGQIVGKAISFLLNRITLMVLAVTLVLFIGGRFEIANASQPNAELDIQRLASCYALGTDTIGTGNILEGKKIYRNCFTQDAVFTVVFPDGATETRIGTDSWADFVYAIFQQNGYLATQHLMGSINVSFENNNNKATMIAYLHATHKRSETSIDVANGTYEDEVVNRNGRWKIRNLNLKLIDFLNLSSPTTNSSAANARTTNSATTFVVPNIPRLKQ